MTPQHPVAQRCLQARARRYLPRPFGIMRHLQEATAHSQGSQFPQPPPPVVPSLPRAGSNVSPGPTFHCEEVSTFLAHLQAEAPDHRLKFEGAVSHLPHRFHSFAILFEHEVHVVPGAVGKEIGNASLHHGAWNAFKTLPNKAFLCLPDRQTHRQ